MGVSAIVGALSGGVGFLALDASGALSGFIALFTAAFVLNGLFRSLKALMTLPKIVFTGERLVVVTFFIGLTYAGVTGLPLEEHLSFGTGVALLSLAAGTWIHSYWP
nr:MAG: hypothetical protein J07AB56_04710 [Candidatus Nanosalinarum sp. J07AB56]